MRSATTHVRADHNGVDERVGKGDVGRCATGLEGLLGLVGRQRVPDAAHGLPRHTSLWHTMHASTHHWHDDTHGGGREPEAVPGAVLEHPRHKPRQDAGAVHDCHVRGASRGVVIWATVGTLVLGLRTADSSLGRRVQLEHGLATTIEKRDCIIKIIHVFLTMIQWRSRSTHAADQGCEVLRARAAYAADDVERQAGLDLPVTYQRLAIPQRLPLRALYRQHLSQHHATPTTATWHKP